MSEGYRGVDDGGEAVDSGTSIRTVPQSGEQALAPGS